MKKFLIFAPFLAIFYFGVGVTQAQAACISFSDAEVQSGQSASQVESICRSTHQIVCTGQLEKYCCDTQPSCDQLNQLGTSNNPTQPGGPCAPGTAGVDLTNCYLLNSSTGATVAGVFGSKPSSIVNLLVKVIFIASGIALFFMIIYSGFLFISGGTKGQEQAKNVMTSAIAGMIIVFSAYWIMQIIRIITGADIGF